MRDHDTPALLLRQQASLNSFSDGADLVDFQQQSIASLLLDGHMNSLGVSDQEIVTDDLNVSTDVRSQVVVGLKVVLIERIFNGDDRVLFRVGLVEGSQVFAADNLATVLVLVLEVKVVSAVFSEEFRSGSVQGDLDFAGVARLLDSLSQELKTFNGVLDVRSETTLVT